MRVHDAAVSTLKEVFSRRRERTSSALIADGFSTVVLTDRWVWRWLGFTAEEGLWIDGEWFAGPERSSGRQIVPKSDVIGVDWGVAPAIHGTFTNRGIRTALPALRNARVVKDDLDLELLSRAARMHARALCETVSLSYEGQPAIAVVQHLERTLFSAGWEGDWSFDPSVMVDRQHVFSWKRPDVSPISSGSLVSVDTGVRYRGLCTDIARVWIEPGDSSRELRDAVAVVQDVLADIQGWMTPGSDASALDRSIKQAIESRGFHCPNDTMLGHGIGVEVHEPPYIGIGQRGALGAGMVLCIEPCIELDDGRRVRAEGMFVITEAGSRRLDND